MSSHAASLQHRLRAGLTGLPRRSALPVVAFAGLPLAVALATGPAGFNVNMLFGDPAAITGRPPYLGLFSNLGILVWWAAATTSLLAALVLRPSPARSALFWGGALAIVLTLDDLFMLHDAVFPQLGVRERFTYATYATATFAYLFVHRHFHATMDWPLLIASVALLSASVVFDGLSSIGHDFPLLEEGTKFAGIVAWCAYHGLAARYWLRRGLGTDAPARNR